MLAELVTFSVADVEVRHRRLGCSMHCNGSTGFPQIASSYINDESQSRHLAAQEECQQVCKALSITHDQTRRGKNDLQKEAKTKTGRPALSAMHIYRNERFATQLALGENTKGAPFDSKHWAKLKTEYGTLSPEERSSYETRFRFQTRDLPSKTTEPSITETKTVKQKVREAYDSAPSALPVALCPQVDTVSTDDFVGVVEDSLVVNQSCYPICEEDVERLLLGYKAAGQSIKASGSNFVRLSQRIATSSDPWPTKLPVERCCGLLCRQNSPFDTVFLYSRFVWKLTAVVRSHGKARDVAHSDILLAIEAQVFFYHKSFVYNF